jgi:signal transduction histidine kinase
MYRLKNSRFTTLQASDVKNSNIGSVNGSLPHSFFLLHDSFCREEMERVFATSRQLYILQESSSMVFMVSDRVVLLDFQKRNRRIIAEGLSDAQKFVLLNGQLLMFDELGLLRRLRLETNTFEPCTLTDDNGKPWTVPLKNIRAFNQYPFQHTFIDDGKKLYKLLPTNNPRGFILSVMLDELPKECIINSVAYRPSDETLVLGTDSRGLFVYQKKHFSTFTFFDEGETLPNSYYAQCLLDNTSLLASNGLIIDLEKNAVKGRFPHSFHPNQLCVDDKGFLYYGTKTNEIQRLHTQHLSAPPVTLKQHCPVSAINRIWNVIGFATKRHGIARLQGDTLQWVYRASFRGQREVLSLEMDSSGALWFGNYFQLYRFDTLTNRLDSFPELQNAGCRALQLVRGKMFVGTYGNGYFVYHKGRFVRMPTGRNNELAHTHAFIEDSDGFLWLTTNRGLFKTHLDAIDAYLQDSTRLLYYYVYQEEDGIRNTEFNGGCSPAYLWLPDGRLSLPSIEGLVMFNPSALPANFSQDTILFEKIEVDGKKTPIDHEIELPADHFGINIHFATSWWSQPYNLQIEYKLEGLHARFQLCEIGQTVCTFGHLKPGGYTLLLRKRCGFGPDDFVYSRLEFTALTPWYAQGWALALYALGFLLAVWGTSALYSRSIRLRNIELQRKVNEQTAELLETNAQLEDNLDKLAQTERDLRKNIRVRDRLISIITHDILTPLRFIGVIARLAKGDKPAKNDPAKQALADVQNAVSKLFHSTQNLLNWVKYQQEQFKTASTNCSPFVLVEQLMQDFSEMARFQGNTLMNDVPEDDIIRTDPQILTIVLHNLMSNAIKFTQNGQIRVNSGVEGNWYLLEVRDTGRGMTPAQIESVRQGMSAQQSVATDDALAGNGIGLHLVAELIPALSGRWEIASPGDTGVRVSIYLPLHS